MLLAPSHVPWPQFVDSVDRVLGNAAQDPSGSTFDKAAQGMSPGEREKLSTAWPTMRAGQQLAAHERTQQALKQSEAMRQTQTKSQGLKQ